MPGAPLPSVRATEPARSGGEKRGVGGGRWGVRAELPLPEEGRAPEGTEAHLSFEERE